MTMIENTFVLLDVETDGFGGPILELAAIKVDKLANIIEQEIEIRTKIPWPENHISGIPPSLRPIGKYSEREALQIFATYCGPSIVVGFNVAFEKRVLKRYGLEINRSLDLMLYLKKEFNLQKYSLSACAKLFNIEEFDSHTALGDCMTMLFILRKLNDKYKITKV